MPLHVDTKDLTDTITRVLDILGNLENPDLLKAIATEVETQTRERITKGKKAPDGTPWKPWSRRYAGSQHGAKAHAPHPTQLYSAGDHTILHLVGHLRDSIEKIVNPQARTAGVGTDIVYGGIHQKMRPYLGLSKDNERDILEEIGAHFEREIARV